MILDTRGSDFEVIDSEYRKKYSNMKGMKNIMAAGIYAALHQPAIKAFSKMKTIAKANPTLISKLAPAEVLQLNELLDKILEKK